MAPYRTFQHGGRSFDIRMFADDDGYRLNVFVDGEPLPLTGFVGQDDHNDSKQGPSSYIIGDLRDAIANVIETHIKNEGEESPP